ncbi:MAG: type II toxin-antitoxin system PemK/MazF family toxin [Candidatus Desantisbacteria bacterium]
MENYRQGEIILVSFPFTNITSVKQRPAIVLLDTGDEDVVVVRVTSQPVQTLFDVKIIEWQQAGLLVPSVIRVHKLATIEKRLIMRRLGTLKDDDWAQVCAAIRQLWQQFRL